MCANLIGMRTAWLSLLLLVGCGEDIPQLPYVVESAESVDSSAVELIVIRDEQGGIEAAVAPAKGGELSGLRIRHKGQWLETLQNARDYTPSEGFAGRGPFLWPATGRNFPPDLEKRRREGEVFNDGAYEHGGVRRPMPIHGFARDLPWTLDESSVLPDSARVVLTLADSPATREMYPFGFKCSVEYFISGGTLEIRYVVRASPSNSEPMFFSLGNHITFVAPLLQGSDPNEMVLASPATVELLKTEYGIPTGETRPAAFANGMRLGEYPPLVPTSLSGYAEGTDPHIEYRDPGGLTIRMSHHADRIPESPVILFNLWGDVGNGFFSPEPWIGLQNSLVQRQGLVFLDPGEDYDWTVRISYESSSAM